MNSGLPKISVVTPSLNQARFLKSCMDSVLDQNYPNLEYVVIDGGSTDGSVELLKQREKQLVYWHSRKDAGQYDAINEGFKHCTGEIMTWINSDDKLHSGTLEIVASIFSERKDVQWLTGRPNGIDENDTPTWKTIYAPLWSREKYLNKQYDPFIQQEGTFWRKSLWDKAGGCVDHSLRYAGDLELWARFFRYSPLHVVDGYLGAFRQHKEQKTHKFMAEYRREAGDVLDREKKLFESGKDKTLLPAPPSIQSPKTPPDIAAEQKLAWEVRRWAENTESLLAIDREQTEWLKRHWWVRLGKSLKIIVKKKSD